MSDDWDDSACAPVPAPAASLGLPQPTTRGRGRGRGRGFRPAPRVEEPGGGQLGNASGDKINRGDEGHSRRNDFEDADQDFGRGRNDFEDEGRSRRNDFGEERRGRRNEDGGRGRRNDDGGRGNGFGREGDGGEDWEKKVPVTYIPAEDEEEDDTGISQGINFDNYETIPVQVTGKNPPQPLNTFKDSKLRNFLLKRIEQMGYKKPTPVQKHALPCIMADRDVMACAQTGSGKTAAFLLPIIHKLLSDREPLEMTDHKVEPHCVIVSPTRELAVQILKEAEKFTKDSYIKSCVVYGGVAVVHQLRKLSGGCHILVGTPGRMLDFLERGRIGFSKIRFVVLDEADRMLDMGFKPDIDRMMTHKSMVSKNERQTLMFSATFPVEIQLMAKQYLKDDYLFITVGVVGGACTDVEQRFEQVSRIQKKYRVMEILRERKGEKTVIFVETKRQADFVGVFLCEHKLPATSIHGDRDQQQREQALRDFKTGKRNILVATAVASRGLDIKGIQHVINFDLPNNVDDYVHRIGRTGRVGNQGLATSFYDPDVNSGLAPALCKILKEAGQEVPDFLEGRGGGFGGYGGSDVRYDDSPEEEEW